MTTDQTQRMPVVVPRRLGDWTLAERLGEGGMGVVWRATRADGREVAIKVLREHIAHDEQARERLRREVRTLARVHHPRVAAVIDADVDGPAPYVVTQYVPGPPLDQVVGRQGPLRGEDLLHLGRGLGEALRAIHAAGIVHRDLKPGNVLMVPRPDGDGLDPVVIDFGIAQVADDVRLTATGLVMGTPGYLSPEVVEGGPVGEATDWWGWAATLAFAASGEPPFGRGPLQVVLDRVVRGRTRLEGVDPQLQPLLAAALDPDPSRRPAEAEVLEGLERYARGEDVTGALPSWSVGHTVAEDLAHTMVQPQVARTRIAPVAPPRQVRATQVAPQQVRPEQRQPQPWPGQTSAQGYAAPHPGVGPSPHAPQQARPLGLLGGQGRVGGARQAPPSQPPTGYPPRGAAQPGTDPQPGATAYPQPEVDPRIGRSRRSGTLAGMLLAFAGLASVSPVLAWIVLATWSVLARTVDKNVTGLVLRRFRAGRRPSDVPVAILSSPLHLLSAIIGTAFALVLPLLVAILAAAAVSFGLTSSQVLLGISPDHPLALAAGSLAGGWSAWWGMGSTSLRRGSRTVVRNLVPEGIGGVVALVLAAAGISLVAWAWVQNLPVSWWPLPGDVDYRQLFELGWF